MQEPPAPAPEMVTAARRHLTDRYGSGVDRVLWELEKRPMPDVDAIRAATGDGALDLGAALVLTQAVRLEMDRLEFEVIEAARASGMTDESIAAVLGLPGAAAAADWADWLRSRYELPYAPSPSGQHNVAATPGEAAERAGRRASRAAERAAQAGRRRAELSQPGRVVSEKDAEKAAANAGEAKVLAGDAMDRVSLGLLRAAATLDRSARGYAELAERDRDERLLAKARDYERAALRYRRMADDLTPGTRPACRSPG